MGWFSKNKAAILGLALAILACVVRYLAVDQTKHPSGWDGYYYVMQVHSYLTYGHLQSADSSLIYPYFILIAGFTGDVIPGIKIGIALLSGLLTGTVFYSLLKKQTPLSWACVAGAYLAFSPLVTYFLLQFPKNALGLIFLILFYSASNRTLMAVLFLATALTHRMTSAFALIGVAMPLLRMGQWKWTLAGVAVVIAISFLPGILHFSDFERLAGQFVAMPQWAPYSFYRIFPNTLEWYFKAELVLISFLIPLSIFFFIKNRRGVTPTSWAWFVIALISVFPFLKFSAGDIGHRFFLVAPVAFIMLISFRDWQPRLQWSAAGVLAIASVFSFRAYKPNYFDPPNGLYSNIASALTVIYDRQQFPLVIAHSPLAEMIIFKTDFDALNWLPPDDMPPQRVLRLIKGVSYKDLRRYLDSDDRSQLRSIAKGYSTLPEDAWQRFVAAASNDRPVMAGILRGGNPMTRRPYYLEKGKAR